MKADHSLEDLPDGAQNQVVTEGLKLFMELGDLVFLEPVESELVAKLAENLREAGGDGRREVFEGAVGGDVRWKLRALCRRLPGLDWNGWLRRAFLSELFAPRRRRRNWEQDLRLHLLKRKRFPGIVHAGLL